MHLGQPFLQRYRIEYQLGQGGMGVVYHAYDTVLQRPVALKVLNAQQLDTTGHARLLIEAQAIAKLNHPNIVNIYDVGQADDQTFIVMELVGGQTLRACLPLPWVEILPLAEQICAALEHAHMVGVIHRDLKPENIMLMPNGQIKLMDFGLAHSHTAPSLTEEGALVGTVAYLAPELIQGDRPNPQSDLYALGVVLYELLTGQTPFTGNLITIISQHLHARVVPPSTHNAAIPATLETLVMQLLAKNPTQRPASAAAVRTALQADLTAPTPHPIPHTSAWTKPLSQPTRWFLAHRYGDLAVFTGRVVERQQLTAWLHNDTERLLIVRALGGFGKSALTWHWLTEDVAGAKWPHAVWWSFYETEAASFEGFLAETLDYLQIESKGRSARQQVNDLLEAMCHTPVLLVLDGFERLLRQFSGLGAAYQGDDMADHDPALRDCVSPAAENFLRGLSNARPRAKVLLTTRLCPRVVEGRDGNLQKGCTELLLKEFTEEDVLEYFGRVNIHGTRAELLATSAIYGHHPLSLSLLTGVVNEDPERPGDIAVALEHAVHGELKAKRTHILQRAYESLRSEHQTLLSQIACFRSSIDYAILKAVFVNTVSPAELRPSPPGPLAADLAPSLTMSAIHREPPLSALDKALKDLRKRGLLQYSIETKRYDMHPLVRHYAYERFIHKEQAHKELAAYFQNAAKPQRIEKLSDLDVLIELYHHLARAGQLDQAFELFRDRLAAILYFQFGEYQIIIELLYVLFPDGDPAIGSGKLPRLKKEADQVWTLNVLANAYSFNGHPRYAISLFETKITILEKQGLKKNVALGLGTLAFMAQLPIGSLQAAEANLRHCLAFSETELDIAAGHQELGRLLIYLGQWEAAEQELTIAWQIFAIDKNVQAQSLVAAYCALHALLCARANSPSSPPQAEFNLQPKKLAQSAIFHAQTALRLAEERARTIRPNELNFIGAHWLLGAALCAAGQLTEAEPHLAAALQRCRAINMVYHEADILLDLARLRRKQGIAQGEREDAERLATEGLAIAERCGYVLQAADLHLFLAEVQPTQALEHAREALRLATCDGEPYVYRVAYDEAKRLVEELGG